MAEDTSHDTGRLRIAVIIGSIRQGRSGAAIGHWVADQVRPRPDMDLDVVDLAELQLPVVMPDLENTATLPVPIAELGSRLAAADAFVIVTPEYNRSFPASLKNAIDWFYDEWVAKPVACVTYGGRARGTRAAEQLRLVFGELHAVVIRDLLSFDLEDGSVGADGRPTGGEAAAKGVLDQLAWWAHSLRGARAARPCEG
jgi:NAD(P)H-dependent FMN reductase